MILGPTQIHAAMTQPRISIIIPCLNEARHIEDCIESVLRQQAPEGGFEVIVADGLSDDGTRETLAELAHQDSRLRVVDNPGRIASTGLNAAIREARGSIIVRMDAHTEYSQDYVRNCVSALQSTGADNVGGAARTKAATYLQSAVSAAYHCPLVVGGARFHNVDYEGYVDTVAYGCWQRSAFERFGYFDEELIRNQDDELNLRIIRNGGKIWQSAKIKSWYRPRTSLRALFKQYAQYGYWKVRVIQKHHLPASWRHLVPGAFVLVLGVLGMLALFSPLALWAWLAVFALYIMLSLAASLSSASRSAWKLLPVLPAVVGCYHFGYGYGFLRGILDFVFRSRGNNSSFGTLSRN
jgi:cellulose synthase/poly-beta-1,6-N-acetylglucosamine synthase-like glycosyltransferase